MSSVVGLHVNAEKRRLEEAKINAESEKTTYVKVNSFGMAPWNFFCIFSFSLLNMNYFCLIIASFLFLFIYLFIYFRCFCFVFFQSIEYLEEQMSSIIQEVTSELPGVYEKAKFNSQNLIGMLQGLVGFTSAAAAKDPFALIAQTLTLVEESSQRCHLKSLDSYLGSIKQWLTFGKHYKPLVDSSELNFDQMNVSSVPQIMQVHLSRCNF